MKEINSFLWTFIFGLPILLIVSFLVWFLLLIIPEITYNALREMAKNLEG